MARTVRDAALATRSARLRLAARGKPYWRMLESGLHLGYRRRATGGTWIARRRDESGTYREEKLGLADDLQDANGTSILDFSQAQTAARIWWASAQRLVSGITTADSGPYTVARALADYLQDYRRRGGKAAESVASAASTTCCRISAGYSCASSPPGGSSTGTRASPSARAIGAPGREPRPISPPLTARTPRRCGAGAPALTAS